jgi:predicted MPP superfamily phosphohydrolase
MRIRVAVISRTFTLSCLAVALYAWAIEPFWLEVTRHAVTLPLAEPLRVVHLSDLHTRGMGGLERQMLERLAAAKPDVVVVTGDVLSTGARRGVSPAEQQAVQEVLSKLQAPLGVFAVPGNWEYWRGHGDPAPLFAGTGVRLLRNSAAEIRRGLWIVGVDDACAGRTDVEAAFSGVPGDAAVIALMHSPSPFPRVASRAPLVLAGHSHGGQVRLPFLGALWLPPETGPFVQGWYTSGSSRLFVSRGVGTSIFRLRFLCRPEIAVIDVRPR